MAASRRAYVDWLRGIAVLCMIEWHVIDAWAVQDGRDGAAWAIVRTVGGFAAPLFLLLAGLAVPLAIDARRRRGAGPVAAAWTVQKRGWQIFGLAHVFRLQSFLFNPNARWSGLLKPDILNILGLGLAGSAWLVGRARTPAARRWWLLAPAVAVVVLTPWSRLWWWPTLLHPRIEAYIRPVGNFGVFSLFPWVAFVPLGAYLGAQLVEATDDGSERRWLRRVAAAGLGLVVVGLAAGWSSDRAGAAFWLASPADMMFKAGVMLMALAASHRVVPAQPEWLRAPVLLFGRTSLFVYWVHVELAYGVLSYPLHHALDLPLAAAGMVAIATLMLVAARWWSRRPPLVLIPDRLRAAGA